ncbi:MAG: hypothetical protein HYZ73_03925 [Elusimicrobia bacterium]|nr:hypothetical protein [Elusimicrobiota bacterium]
MFDGLLYCRLFIPPGSYGLSWKVGSNNVEFERGSSPGDYYNDEYLWTKALVQIERRLRSALGDFARYNRFVEKNLPFSCRAGKVQRRLTWPKNARPPLPLRQIRQLESVLDAAKNLSPLGAVTLSHYLNTVAIAYDAVFKELRPLSPLEKYKKKADGRHGGLLDLPPEDPEAFSKWFYSRQWAGTHPWEIVFGYPHGIMLSPHYHEESRLWNYVMWVDSLGWYASAAWMAIALCKHKIPFEFHGQKEVTDALKGIDEVDICPDLYAVHYDDLKKKRPDALRFIRWDPIPQLSPITPDQTARISQTEAARGMQTG